MCHIIIDAYNPPQCFNMNINEKVQIIKWYYARGSSADEVVRRFAVTFKNRPAPTKSTVMNIVHKLDSTGCLTTCRECNKPKKQSKERPVNEERKRRELHVCSIADTRGRCSTREIAAEVGINGRTVCNILKRHGYRHYRIAVERK